MKNSLLTRSLLLLGISALLGACSASEPVVEEPLDPKATAAVTLQLEDPPTCGSCIAGYKQVLGALPGCGRVEATPNDPRITVHYDPARVDVARIIDALEASGDHAQQVP
jgi:copper chaperone CopZ